MRLLAGLTVLGILSGCGTKPQEKQVEKPPSSIVGKTTQDIGEYKPEAGAKVSDSKITATDPITAPTSAYGPMLERISKTQIEQAVNLFHATEDRYPKDLDEFMELIIRPNNIKLPVLPGGKIYQYDVENHKLVVVDGPGADAPKP